MLPGWVRNRINTKLLLITLSGILTATALLTYFSSSMIRSAFQMRYEDKLQAPGRVFLAQYTYKDILPYINILKELDNLAGKSEQYTRDREYALDIEKKHTDKDYPPDYFHAKERMDDYIEKLSELKDEKYHTMKKRMLELRVGAGLTDFFILADLDIPDYYIYIFDAVFQGDATSSFGEDYGTPVNKTDYAQAREAFTKGKTVIVMSNMNDTRHDNPYYSFMPVKDNYGNVRAVIGISINMYSLEAQLQSFLLNSLVIILIGSFFLLIAMYIALREFITKPVQELTAISADIAAGNIEKSIPAWILSRQDEMGILGKSYASMSGFLRETLDKNDVLLEAAISGRLDIRSDPGSLRGLFAQMVSKTNDMLDVIGSDFDSIPGSLAILDAEFNIVYTNNQFKQIFEGMTDRRFFQTMLEAGDGDGIEMLKNYLASRLDEGEFSSLVWVDLSDERRCLAFLCSRRASWNGKNNGAIIVVTDATEQVTAKERALSANKAKTEFLSRVSHELRTPLNVILSMAKLGLNDREIGDSLERFRKIVASSSHLSDIINDVLEMSRMESGKMEIKPGPLNLKEVARECVELLRQRAQDGRISLISSIDPILPENMRGDEFRLKQILINLLSNALKFTTEGSVSLDIKVLELRADSCDIRFTVSDTGIGMSETFLEKVFLPFEQEDSFLSRRYEGSGLGLSICHNLVALMGGDMTVESELGAGSRFMFTIPFDILEVANEEIAQPPQITGDFLRGKRILIVDDIDVNRLIVAEVLADTGADLEEAGDGEEALRKYQLSPQGYFDCVLMDIQMPKMNGYAATAAIRASKRADNDITIIAMTANALKEDIDNALAAGMNDHIAKPIDFDALLMKLKEIIT